MKALIWIIIIAAVAWGAWYFMKDDTAGIPAAGNPDGQVEGASDAFGNGDAGADLDAEAGLDVKG